jgi:hypothetical protein
MSNQAITEFPDRVQRAIAEADGLAAQLGRTGQATVDVTTSPQYQELVRLKVVLEVETSRTLSETARVSSELVKSELAHKLASMEEES